MAERSKWLPVVLVLVALAAAGAAWAQAEEQEGGMPPEMMAAWEKAAATNEHHQHLARFAGQWNASGKFWMQPGAPPTESQGKATNEMIMDGRFLQSKFQGEFMGQQFTGMGIDGYDNVLGKHVGTWIDSAGTMIMQFLGECAEGGKVTNSRSDFTDPMTGQKTTMKGRVTMVDPNKFLYESWSQGPDGEFFKSMEITYTRI